MKEEVKDKIHDLWWRFVKGPITFWNQRRTRGFDDSELWSLDHTIMEFALPRLKALREMAHGYPAAFLYGEDADWPVMEAHDKLSEAERKRADQAAFDAWKRTIRKMERAMELWIKHDGWFYEKKGDDYVENEKLKAEFEEGWELFHKYFFALWD